MLLMKKRKYIYQHPDINTKKNSMTITFFLN